ncbi:MAG: hypothetical protein HGN29_13725 [Asgard group archaeon]|nr:hypothetical protein [Asgard group archaeon]
MDELSFVEYCTKLKTKTEDIEQNLSLLREFRSLLNTEKEKNGLDKCTVEDLDFFISNLTENKKDSWDNLAAVVRYSLFAKREDLTLFLYDILDGAKVLDTLVEKLQQSVDKETFNRTMEGFELPPLRTPHEDKPFFTKKIIDNLEENLPCEKCKEILSSGIHIIGSGTLQRLRAQFLAAENLDDFLFQKHQRLIANLTKNLEEGTKFYTQEVDESVIDYVSKDQTIESGKREGDKVIITKIPFLTKEYLLEKDPKMKSYYYCHCPWIRDSIKKGDMDISAMFCYCSAGYYKQQWDSILNQPVRVDVIDSVLKGDEKCSFIVHLPDKYA